MLVAENVAGQLERRISFRRAMKVSVENAMKGGALGAKVAIAGRLNGAEMASREQRVQGSIPLHTLRADIDLPKRWPKPPSVSSASKSGSIKGLSLRDRLPLC